jgi:hypothetical protein
VRAPAKRLPCESGVSGSNPDPSASLAVKRHVSSVFSTDVSGVASSNFGNKIDVFGNKIGNKNHLSKDSFETFIEFKKAQGVSPSMSCMPEVSKNDFKQ